MDMNNNHEKKGGHFFNGFFWGAVIGGGFTYLLTTKKGRDFLKELAQDGLDMLDGLTMEPEMAEEEELTPIVSEEVIVEEPRVAPVVTPAKESEPKKTPEMTVKKRFFRAKKK